MSAINHLLHKIVGTCDAMR